jgi:hypothetical protein
VRILAVSDCCHGGGVFFVAENNFDLINSGATFSHSVEVADDVVAPINGIGSVAGEDRELSMGQRNTHVAALHPFYDEVRNNLLSSPHPIDASVLIMGACEPSQKAKDGEPNGAFTKALLEVVRFNPPPNFRFDPPPDYIRLHAAILQQFAGGSQTPVLIDIGSAPPFTAHRPFTIDIEQ